jgi:hypothetical protein
MPQPPRQILAILLCVLALVGERPLVGGDEAIRFADVTVQAGLRDSLDGMMAHAAAWGDVDGDGDADLFVGGFADRPNNEYAPAPGPVANRLFRNLSNGRFEQIRNPALELYGRTTDAVFVDLDNDGLLDLYVTNNSRSTSTLAASPQRDAQLQRSTLFRNDAGTFVDVSAASGGCDQFRGRQKSRRSRLRRGWCAGRAGPGRSFLA